MKVILSILFLISNAALANPIPEALPVPQNVEVKGSQWRAKVWNSLTEKQKRLAYHLLQAGKYGRDILFLQTHRNTRVMRDFLKWTLNHKPQAVRALGEVGYSELVRYTAIFNDAFGPYATANRKWALKSSPESLRLLVESFAIETSTTGKSVPTEEIVRFLTDSSFETLNHPSGPEGSELPQCGGNLYDKGILAAELAQLKVDLNHRVVRTQSGKAALELQALSNRSLNPVIKNALEGVRRELRLALQYTLTEHQKAQINYFIRYIEKGRIDDFRSFNIEWVKDKSNSLVDFMMGYVEVYEDFNGKIGSWESIVQVVGMEESQKAFALTKLAPYFEEKMPYGKFKKTFPKNYSPPAMLVYYFDETSVGRSAGYNLPNFDDIRKDVGAKNVIRIYPEEEQNDPKVKDFRRKIYTEFAPKDKIDVLTEKSFVLKQWITLLHEIIGHGSGTYDETKYPPKKDPVSELGTLGSALEEQRADLTALIFIDDPKLVEQGFISSAEEAKQIRELMYQFYLTDFLVRVSKLRTFEQAHLRGRYLLMNRLLRSGAVARTDRDGNATWTPENMVLTLKDSQRFQDVARELLGELQSIKANRLTDDMKKLFDADANPQSVSEPWVQGLIKRGQNVQVDTIFVDQPWKVTSDLKIQISDTKDLEEAEKLRE